jgi:hypothetical protein
MPFSFCHFSYNFRALNWWKQIWSFCLAGLLELLFLQATHLSSFLETVSWDWPLWWCCGVWGTGAKVWIHRPLLGSFCIP